MKKWKWWYLVPVAAIAFVCITPLVIPYAYDVVRSLVKELGQDPDAYTNESIAAYGSIIAAFGGILAAFLSFLGIVITAIILVTQLRILQQQSKTQDTLGYQDLFVVLWKEVISLIEQGKPSDVWRNKDASFYSYLCTNRLDVWDDHCLITYDRKTCKKEMCLLFVGSRKESLLNSYRDNRYRYIRSLTISLINIISLLHERRSSIPENEWYSYKCCILNMLTQGHLAVLLYEIIGIIDEYNKREWMKELSEFCQTLIGFNLFSNLHIHSKWKEFFIKECGIPAEAFKMPKM